MAGLAGWEVLSNHGDRKSLAKRNAGRYYTHAGFLKLIIHCYGVLIDPFGPDYSFEPIGGTASAAVFLCPARRMLCQIKPDDCGEELADLRDYGRAPKRSGNWSSNASSSARLK